MTCSTTKQPTELATYLKNRLSISEYMRTESRTGRKCEERLSSIYTVLIVCSDIGIFSSLMAISIFVSYS